LPYKKIALAQSRLLPRLRRAFWIGAGALVALALTFALLSWLNHRGLELVLESQLTGRVAREARSLALDREIGARPHMCVVVGNLGVPTALDGAESAELATAAVSGVDALDATFARYLPNLVTALVVPVAVLALVVSIDPLAAGVMVLTLPLVPIFMWLVGRYTEHRARARWQAMSLLANHFLDVVRGLPTLRAHQRIVALILIGVPLLEAGRHAGGNIPSRR